MSTRILFAAVLGLPLIASATLPAISSSTSPELLQKDSEHKKVGEMMGECITAYVEREGRADAEEELGDYLEKKWKKAAKGRSPLALSDDLGAALWYATNYSKVKGIKKGKVEDLEVPVSYYGEDFVATSSVWVPKKYSAKNKYPLVLCIPEAGKRPQDTINELWEDGDVRDGAIIVALGMPENTEHWGSLGEQNSSENAGGAGILLSTFKQVQETFAIDFDRVFLAGHGVGVAAAMQIASSFPDRFCGIIGRTGDAAELSPTNLSNLPCFFAGAGKRASAFSDAAKEAGYVEPTIQADAKLADIWAWMQDTSRRSNPETVQLDPGSPFPKKAYWIAVPNIEYSDEAKLKATADRASNTITIESVGVSTVTVYFNDTIVDLDKPVKVICNGVENEDLIPRSFPSMMDQIYRTRSDPGKLYTAFRSYDILNSKAPKDAAQDSE